MSQILTTDTLHYYKGHYYTGSDIAAMREWIADCQSKDMDEDYINELTPDQVLAGVQRHVDGGLAEFINNMI